MSQLSNSELHYWNRLRRVLMALQNIQDDLQMKEGMHPGEDTWYHTYSAKVRVEEAMLSILHQSRDDGSLST